MTTGLLSRVGHAFYARHFDAAAISSKTEMSGNDKTVARPTLLMSVDEYGVLNDCFSWLTSRLLETDECRFRVAMDSFT
jgi:hypothetical protein